MKMATGQKKPKSLGTVVRLGGKNYIITAVRVGWVMMPSGDVIEHRVYAYVPVPKGMKASDLGRRFHGPILESEFVKIKG